MAAPKKIRLSINEASNKEIKSVFKDLCENVALQTEEFVKRKILDFRGTNRSVDQRVITIEDVFKLCKKLGVGYEISFTYDKKFRNVKELEADAAKPEPVLKDSETLCDSYNKMVKQKEEITNPDLQDIVQNIVPAIVPAPEKPLFEASVPFAPIPEFKP